MNKEHIKTFILILLIINSIQLSAQIWFDKNLWPDGYAFLDTVKNVPVIRTVFGTKSAFGEEDVFAGSTKPKRIIVNGGGAREVYPADTEEYDAALRFADDVIDSFKENGAESQSISYEQWQNLFKGKSLYIDLGYTTDGNNLNVLYSAKSSEGKFSQFSSVSGFLITPDSVTNNCTITVCDNSDRSVTEYRFKCDASKLLQYIEESTYAKQQNDTFAFEINLDYSSESSGNVERMVELSPLVLVSVSADEADEKNAIAEPVFKSMSELERFAEKTLPAFGYNPSSLRKTVQNDKTVVYVENNATIRYHFDGTVEYSAVSQKRGLKKSNSVNDCRQAVNDVLKLVREMCDEAGIRKESLNLHLCSDLMDNRENKYDVEFENTFGGTVVNYGNGNAVNAVVDDGYITDFKIHLANFSESENSTPLTPMLSAIDLLYVDYSRDKIAIDDVYKCFDFKAPGEISVKWAFKIKNTDGVVVTEPDMPDRD